MNPPIDFRSRKPQRNWNEGLVIVLLVVLLSLVVLALSLAGCQQRASHPGIPDNSATALLCADDQETRDNAYSAVRAVLYRQRGGAPMTNVCRLDDGVRATVYGEWATTRFEATLDGSGEWRIERRVRPVDGVEATMFWPPEVTAHDALVAAIDATLTEVCSR